MRPVPIMIALLLALTVSSAAAQDSGPRTVASIAPVHSLVAQVAGGEAAPHLLMPPGASPHDFALRPSDAAALQEAEIVFWVGPMLEPWLERALGTLAADARVVRLGEAPGLTVLPVREGAAFGEHGHGHGHGDGHGDGHGKAAGYDHGEIDPHLWLDPGNAKLWLGAIAAALAEADPEGRGRYEANAEAGRLAIDAAVAAADARLAPLRGRPFIVFHDAFHYFEARFDIEAAGAIAISDARAPGPARVAEIRALIERTGALCLFREPQFDSPLMETVAEGTDVRIGVLDPIGAALEPGAELYPALLRGLAVGFADCLG